MNIVVTMGGLGERFRRAGYTLPKYQIEVRGRTLFEWAMLSLQAFRSEKFIFLVRKEDNAVRFIQEQCKKMGIILMSIIELENLTKGQAETALYARYAWDQDQPIFIYNIDTYVEPGFLNAQVIQGDGFIPCFSAVGDHWSFVRLDRCGNACEVREKKRISDHCSIGAYYFSSGRLFEDVYEAFYVKKNYIEAGEQYIAPMYNLLIARGKSVRIQNIEADRVHVLGTPDEVRQFAQD